MVVPRNQAGFDRKLFPPIVKNTTPSGRSEYCRLVVLFEFIVIAKNILPNLFISHLKKLIETLYLAAGWFSWIVNTLTEPWKEEEERLPGRRLCWFARTRRVHTLFRKVKLQTVLYSKRFVNVNMARLFIGAGPTGFARRLSISRTGADFIDWFWLRTCKPSHNNKIIRLLTYCHTMIRSAKFFANKQF